MFEAKHEIAIANVRCICTNHGEFFKSREFVVCELCDLCAHEDELLHVGVLMVAKGIELHSIQTQFR